MKEKKLFSFGQDFIGVSYDDPSVTETEKLCYDACASVKKEVKPENLKTDIYLPVKSRHLGCHPRMDSPLIKITIFEMIFQNIPIITILYHW